MKRAAVYVRVSTVDQNFDMQLLDLRQMAAARGYEVVREYTDKISGTKAKRLQARYDWDTLALDSTAGAW
jgi:DNA invertase Pin-like site-specific DNA recombinase